jgi:hypothetical protein
MFSPARGRGKTTPYIPTAKAGSFTAILGKNQAGGYSPQSSQSPHKIPFLEKQKTINHRIPII